MRLYRFRAGAGDLACRLCVYNFSLLNTCSSGDNVLNMLLDEPKKIGKLETAKF